MCHCLSMSDGVRDALTSLSTDLSSQFGGFIEYVFLPGCMEEVPPSYFRQSSLSRVTFGIGSVLKRIGKESFYGCRELREIEIPANVEEIGVSSFDECSSLSRVTFVSGSALKRIGSWAFSGCKELRDIEIPVNVEEIGTGCFSCCSSLSRVTFGIGSVLKLIGKEAFYGCGELREIEIPASVEEIGESCFSAIYDDMYMSSLSRVTFGIGSVLKRIGNEAFSGCSDLQEIEIPATVEEIGVSSFYECCSLSRITFGSGSVLKQIGEGAFSGCKDLREIEIPASVEEICVSYFTTMYDGLCASSLSRVTFGIGTILKRIGKEAFCGCDQLREIEIPASVEEIGEACFSGCSSLFRVTFATGSVLKRIGSWAFYGCNKLQEIEIPASVEIVGNPGVVVRRPYV